MQPRFHICQCQIISLVNVTYISSKTLWKLRIRLEVIFKIMSARQAIQVGTKIVKPVLSTSSGEARSRVLNLYKAWYRQVPYLVKDFDIPKSEEQCRQKVKEMFLKNKHVTDIRVIDMLVIKGQMELKESVNMWKQKGHIMSYFKPTEEPKPKDFLSKFLSGNE